MSSNRPSDARKVALDVVRMINNITPKPFDSADAKQERNKSRFANSKARRTLIPSGSGGDRNTVSLMSDFKTPSLHRKGLGNSVRRHVRGSNRLVTSKATSKPSTPVSRLKHTLNNLGLAASLPEVTAAASPAKEVDLANPLILRFGTDIMLRNVSRCKSINVLDDGTTNMCGNGIGNPDEVFTLVNVHFHRRTGPVRHGDVIAFCSTARGHGNGKYLAVSSSKEDNGALRVNRSSFGQAEKWTILSQRILDATKADRSMASRTGAVIESCDRVVLRTMHNGLMRAVASADDSSNSVLTASAPGVGGLDASKVGAVWNIVLAGTPFLPAWTRSRVYLTSAFLNQPVCAPDTTETQPPKPLQRVLPLASYPVLLQERMLLEDMLYALLGIDGRFVEYDESTESFEVDDACMDSSLAFLVRRLLPLCNNYLAAKRFTDSHSRFEYGLTVHAFCAAIRHLLKEYTLLVAQLETQNRQGELTLQKLFFYLQPSLRTMQCIMDVCRAAGHTRGGELLNTVHRVAAEGGAQKSRELFTYLIKQSTVPYFKMLERWIYQGMISDPYNEFMIHERKDLSKEDLRQDYNTKYWDQRYTIRLKAGAGKDITVFNNPLVPWFLRGTADKILTTGKYLNVIRECGRGIACPVAEEIKYRPVERDYALVIEKAYAFASRELLDLLMRENKLLERLRSMKNYFFWEKGDLFVHFMDIAYEDLNKSTADIDLPKLDSLLKLAIETSSANADAHRENLVCVFERYTLNQHLEAIHFTEHGMDGNIDFAGLDARKFNALSDPTYLQTLKGIDAFSLDYKIEWPLSLVISRHTLTKYQILFRHILTCKHVELQLCETWLDQQTTKGLNLGRAMARSYSLRQRMLHFVQNLVYYVTVEVLEPRWHEMQQRLEKAQTVDEVIKYHIQFLDTCLKECLLTTSALLKILSKLLISCILFAEQIKAFMESVTLDRRATPVSKKDKELESQSRVTRIRHQSEHIVSVVTQRSYVRMLHQFHDNFNSLLDKFMSALQDESHSEYHQHLSNLCTRLDFNGFYQAQSVKT